MGRGIDRLRLETWAGLDGGRCVRFYSLLFAIVEVGRAEVKRD